MSIPHTVARLLFPLLLLLLIAAPPTAAGIYTWTDDSGKVHYGDRPPSDRDVEAVTVRVNTYTAPAEISRVDLPFTGRNKVVLYTTQRCGYCRRAKQYLDGRNIAYTEYDVETTDRGRRDFKKLNGQGVPVILVGDQRMNGYNEERLAGMLDRAGY
jgi:glutaredoxin